MEAGRPPARPVRLGCPKSAPRRGHRTPVRYSHPHSPDERPGRRAPGRVRLMPLRLAARTALPAHVGDQAACSAPRFSKIHPRSAHICWHVRADLPAPDRTGTRGADGRSLLGPPRRTAAHPGLSRLLQRAAGPMARGDPRRAHVALPESKCGGPGPNHAAPAVQPPVGTLRPPPSPAAAFTAVNPLEPEGR